MLLPKSRLASVDYYTYRRGRPLLENGPCDIITVRWKEWWRPRTKLVFSLLCVERGEHDGYGAKWISAREVIELLDQLRQHCRSN